MFAIEFWMICVAGMYYDFQAFPYTGKTNKIEESFGDHVAM